MLDLFESLFVDIFENDEVAEIHEMLKTVCHLHKLPLALIWMIHHGGDCLLYMDAVNDSSMEGYVRACAGKFVNSMHRYLVPNVSLLDLADYPCFDEARKFGLLAAMAIRLKVGRVLRFEYVLEIFLPTNLVDSVEQNKLFDEILLSLRKNCEGSETMELQMESLLNQQEDQKFNLSKEVEASNVLSSTVSKISFLAFTNVGLNLKEKIQNNRVETDELRELATATECELLEDETLSSVGSEEAELPNTSPMAVSESSSSALSNGGLNLNENLNEEITMNLFILPNTGETDEPNEQEVKEQNAAVGHGVDGNKQVVEMHDRRQVKSINKGKKTDTQPTNGTPQPRKTKSVVWEFFSKVQENGVVWAKCPVCDKKLGGESKNGTSSLHKHGCFKDWKEDAKQQSVSNVDSRTKVNPKAKASSTNGANAPTQAKRRKLAAKIGDTGKDKEREEEEKSNDSAIASVVDAVQDTIVSDISQAAVSNIASDQVQELTVQDDYATKETTARGLKDQEHHLSFGIIAQLQPIETQSSSQQPNNTAIAGIPQVGCTTAEVDIVATSTTSSIPTTIGFSVISAASQLRRFLSQSPQVLLSLSEIDRFCSLLNAAINAASNEWEKHPMIELLAEVHRLEEAIATCPSSSRLKTPLQGYENLSSAISKSARSRFNLEAEITSLDDQAAQLEEQLKAIYKQRLQKKQDLSLLVKNEAVMQTHALQNNQAIVGKLKIDNIIAGMSALFEFVKSVLPEP
ncbi:unnamed protein product [Dovyalis caffra]|uniref:BED-type domain-containing protein n=1 Tax=Dovyalis caffra TaxID=77055 RepID=A0AAV1RPW4_9ROSI|nr:unnamed protein product [Dovyalis caffra]